MNPIVASDTFFSKTPHWEWLIIFYFFFGGIAAGCFVYSALLDLFGRPGDRKLANLGYIVALPALALCPPLLVLDLNRPERFWHMLFANNSGGPILKTYSPMSLGAWALAAFGIFVTAAFLGAMAERNPQGSLRAFAFLRQGALAKIIAVVGGFFGFLVAGYTGVLLSVSNRPLWADTPMLGALFLLSSATTSAALLLWLGRDRVGASSAAWLARMEGWVGWLELAVIVVMVVTLGPVARLWAGIWGVLLAVMVVLGLIAPWFMHRRHQNVALASVLALAGGLLLRAVVILSSGAA